MSIFDKFKSLKKKPVPGEVFRFQISGMHCTACSIAIDQALEDVPGVFESSTHYASAETVVHANPSEVSPEQMLQVIKNAGYEAKQK